MCQVSIQILYYGFIKILSLDYKNISLFYMLLRCVVTMPLMLESLEELNGQTIKQK